MARFYHADLLAEECDSKYKAMKTFPAFHHDAKQVAAMLSLSGLRDADEMAEIILKDGAKGMSTFMSYYILKAASKKSMEQTLQILEEYYGGMLDMGATTFWEDFNVEWMENAGRIDELTPQGKTDIHGDKGAFCYVGYRHSLCHGWSSGPAAFLAEEVLGIHIVEPGCKKIKIRPNLGGLKWAEGDYPTPFGLLHVSHRLCDNGQIETTFHAPDQVVVEIDT